MDIDQRAKNFSRNEPVPALPEDWPITSAKQRAFLARLEGQPDYQALLNLGIPASSLKEVCWRANQFHEVQRLARHYSKLDKIVSAMQRLLKLQADLAHRVKKLDPPKPIRSFVISLDRRSRDQALIEFATAAHTEVVDCVSSLFEPLPDEVVQRIDLIAQSVASLGKALSDRPKTGAPKGVGENLFIGEVARLCRRAAKDPHDALCCELYKFVFERRVVELTAYKVRRTRLEKAS